MLASTFLAIVYGPVEQDCGRTFLSRLEEWDCHLEGEDILVGTGHVGQGRVCSREELPSWALESAEHAMATCPWSSRALGGFAWTHVIDPFLARDGLLKPIAYSCRGPIMRIDTHEVRLPVAEHDWSATQLSSRRGFADGGALLATADEDPDYLGAMATRARDAIRAAGNDAEVGVWPSNNPLRIVGDLRRDGVVVDDPDALLSEVTLRLWSFDPRLPWRDDSFWEDGHSLGGE